MRCGPGQSELPMQATDGSRSSSKFEAAWAPEGRGDHRHREHSLSPKDARIVDYGARGSMMLTRVRWGLGRE